MGLMPSSGGYDRQAAEIVDTNYVCDSEAWYIQVFLVLQREIRSGDYL